MALMPAAGALVDVTAERGGAAALDGGQDSSACGQVSQFRLLW